MSGRSNLSASYLSQCSVPRKQLAFFFQVEGQTILQVPKVLIHLLVAESDADIIFIPLLSDTGLISTVGILATKMKSYYGYEGKNVKFFTLYFTFY